jgi:signal transduction histidine kinase
MRAKGFLLEILSFAFWAALVSTSLWRSNGLHDQQVRDVAEARARMLFTMVETMRLWNASHGGLYATVDDSNQPNPYLDVLERDVEIFGRPYTKINPAYMTRQLSEMFRARKGMQFHLTSANPIRPANAPDAWEATTLAGFAAGGREVFELTPVEGGQAFRYMAALTVEKPCLQCHAKQDYRLGDVRGGISVSLPAAPVIAELEPQRHHTILVHGVGFVLLWGASLLFIARLKQSWRGLAAARADQDRLITERTAELRAAVDDLARSNAELEQFAYVASHDLQEPLRMMGTYAQLIERRYAERLDDEGREFIGFMTEGAGRMRAMIDDLLAYSRVDRGPPVFAAVDSELALDTALANLAAAVTESKAAVVRPSVLPLVWGEAAPLARLFQNVVGNALKYRHPDRPPRVEVTVATDKAGWATFSVRDNGIGIPEDCRERVFQIFQRLHARGAYPGTGIGLAIAKKIVERHGGSIWIEAAGDGGSVFRFTLPLAK